MKKGFRKNDVPSLIYIPNILSGYMDCFIRSMILISVLIMGPILVSTADGESQDRRDSFNSACSFETKVPYYPSWSTRDYWPVGSDKKFEIDDEGNIYLRSYDERTNKNWIIVLNRHGKEILTLTEK
jgi:hypothetical protein